MKTKSLLLTAALFAVLHGRAAANDIIYQTGFEPPGFAPGQSINGLDGWQVFQFLPGAEAIISTENPRDGAQSLRLRGVFNTCVRPILDETASNPPLKVELRVDVRLDGLQTGTLGTPEQDILSANFSATVPLPNGNTLSLGGFFVSSGGKIWAFTPGPRGPIYHYSVPAPLGAYHSLILHVDFFARTVTYIVDGVDLGSTPFDPFTNLSEQLVGGSLQLGGPPNPITTPDYSYDPANYTAYFDNYSAEALPLTPADTDVRFAATDYAVEESAHVAEVNVTRRGYTNSAVSVKVSTADETAREGQDYNRVSTRVSFAPGETIKAVKIRIEDDERVETDETIRLTLSMPSPNVLLSRSTATLWVLDDERAGSADPRFDFSPEALGISKVLETPSIAPLHGGRFLASVFGEDSSANFVGTLARFKADGSLDSHFEPYPLPYGTGPSQITPILEGWRLLVNLGDHLVRLRATGREDIGFNVMTTFGSDPGYISDVVVQPDEKIIIAGFFDNVNGVPRNNIARLRVNGEVDTSFNPGAGTDDFIVDAALQRDGKILIGGYFQNVGGQPHPLLARLNRDGSLDSSLAVGAGFGDSFNSFPELTTVVVQPNGRILVGGFFDSYQGASHNSLVRLLPDGSADGSFDIGTGFASSGHGLFPERIYPGRVSGLTLQPDGKALVAGMFVRVDDVFAPGIVRLNRDGKLDPAFRLGGTDSFAVPPLGFIPPVVGGPALAVMPDGDILTTLVQYRSGIKTEPVSYSGVVRLNGDPDCDDNRHGRLDGDDHHDGDDRHDR